MNLKKFGKSIRPILIIIIFILAAPKTTTTNPPPKNQKQKSQNNRRKQRNQKIVNPSRNLSRGERLQRRQAQKDKKTVTQSQTTPPPPPPLPKNLPKATSNTVPDSESEMIRKSWTNLDNDFSFSGDSNNILNKIKSFSVHKPIKKKFKRRAVIVPSIYHTMFCDLIDYKSLKGSNKNYSYILVLIDAFSRYSWTRALKSKEAKECAQAIDDILSGLPYRPAFFASDAGNEFNAKDNDDH